MTSTPGGIPVTNFSLAVEETYKNSGGEKKTSTLWIRCVAWQRWAEIAGRNGVRQGEMVREKCVSGTISPPKNGS
jgi:single-stranded DNA-binding protein